MTWQDQGRQAHGWFGSGRGAQNQSSGDPDADLFEPSGMTRRIDYVANSVAGHLPPRLRSHAAASPDDAARDRLRTVMSAWSAADELDRDTFRRRFLDPYTSDAVTDLLREAARRTADARAHQDLGEAGAALTQAEMKVGLDRWPRFLADASRRAEAAGSDDGAGHYQVAQRERPGVMSDASPPHRPTTPAEHLTEAAKAAYDSYSRDCSHAVWAVLKDVVNPDEPYRTANEPIAHVARRGSGWRQVTSLQEASDLANAGKVVVGGLAVPRGNGHVLIVMPGPMQPAGGFGGIHRTEILYPPSMSGSLSSWQGAMSRGQRTVRDAWSNDDWKGVTFWVHK